MKKTNRNAPVEVEFRRPPRMLLAVLAILVLLSTAALLALGMVRGAIREQTDKLRDQISAIEYANTELENIIKTPDSIENVQKIAGKELDLVDPDTVVINPEG